MILGRERFAVYHRFKGDKGPDLCYAISFRTLGQAQTNAVKWGKLNDRTWAEVVDRKTGETVFDTRKKPARNPYDNRTT